MSETAQAITQFISEEEYKEMYSTFDAIAVQATNIQRLPRAKFDQARILDAWGEAFELIGGIPRLAMWAHENPSKFYAQMARLGAKSQGVSINASGPLVIRPSLPPSALDDE